MIITYLQRRDQPMSISFITTLLFLLSLLTICVLAELLFRQKTYYKVTRNGYFQTVFDKGRYGEYLTWKSLKSYEHDGGKFLFNCYLPAENGKTSEIDVILIHSSGIFVMESKNYSGWIFGKETDSCWTQTLPSGRGKSRKERFYNPVKQNATHIKWLKNIVNSQIPIYSIIVFSKRCTLKNITVANPQVTVIRRPQIHKVVKHIGSQSLHTLTKEEIANIYEILYPYTQVDTATKLQHINNINKASLSRSKMPERKKQKEAESTPTSPETISERNPVIDTVQAKNIELAAEKLSGMQVCPKCGAELALRTVARGVHSGEQFYGCSRFPKCRYRTTSTANASSPSNRS